MMAYLTLPTDRSADLASWQGILSPARTGGSSRPAPMPWRSPPGFAQAMHMEERHRLHNSGDLGSFVVGGALLAALFVFHGQSVSGKALVVQSFPFCFLAFGVM